MTGVATTYLLPPTTSRGPHLRERHEDEVRPPLHPVLSEDVRDVEFHRSLGHVQPLRDFFVGEILHHEVVDLALPAGKLAQPVRAPGPPNPREGPVHESGKKRSGNPESPRRHLVDRPDEAP